MRILCILTLLMSLSWTLLAQEKEKMPIRDYETMLQAKLTTLSVGDSKDSVLSKMGGVKVVKVRGLGVNDEFAYPYRSEQLTLESGQTAEIIWYKAWEKEKATRYAYTYVPIVFQEGKMIGQGVSFARTYARDEGFNLTMP